MDINSANLNALMKTYNTLFQQGLGFTPPVNIDFLFRDFPSSTAANFYAWLEQIPGFREWVGDRVFSNVRSGKFEIVNRSWEDSVSMGKDEIEDDQYGVYAPMVQMMGEAWTLLKYKLPLEVLYLNSECFDGKAFFADDHAYGDNTIDNVVTDALSETTFEAAFTAAVGWQFSNDELCRTRFTHLVHGPKLHATAYHIVDAETHAAGGVQVPNPNHKRVQRVELEDLAGDYDDYWFLLDASKPIKPVARQIRREAAPLMDMRVEQVMRTGRFDVMSDGRAAAGPTFPHMAYAGIL
ncbi:MAG: Mu-like prophage major head subunit gpT family protein [Lentisphaerae bacterium]|nr:Mu-like prophage major head subunit gpT family protein [Lentisphaerota bacterium]